MHISDFRKFLRCPKMYQLSLKDNKKGFPFLNIDIDIDESIKNKFKIDNCYTGTVNGGTYVKSNISFEAIDMSSGKDFEAQTDAEI